FGGVTAADEIDLLVRPGEIVSVIGPNGSGKTTLFNMLTGIVRPDGGMVMFRGINITRLPPHKIGALGMARTFQNQRLFMDLSILENVLIGQHARLRAGLVGAIFRPPRVGREEAAAVEWAKQVMGLFGVRRLPRMHFVVCSLS